MDKHFGDQNQKQTAPAQVAPTNLQQQAQAPAVETQVEFLSLLTVGTLAELNSKLSPQAMGLLDGILTGLVDYVSDLEQGEEATLEDFGLYLNLSETEDGEWDEDEGDGIEE